MQRRAVSGGTGAQAPRVLIVGAGFAGLEAARVLLHAEKRFAVTIVDRNVYSTFQPLLYQVATGGLNPGDVTYPVRSLAAQLGASFRWGTVTRVDGEAREVELDDGARLGFDYLLLATGVNASFFGIPGAAEHSVALYTRAQAIELRDSLMTRLERIATRPGSGATIVVVGGGPTGVEMAGTLAELRNAALPVTFPELDRRRVHVVLVEQGPELLAPFDPRLRTYTHAQLLQRDVDVRLRTSIEEVGEDFVVLDGGERLSADVTIWAAGVSAPPALAGWGLPQGRGGRITVEPDLRVVGHSRIFAAGDIAVSEEDPQPQLAPPAIQGGAHAAEQILRLERREATEPFRYRDKGFMATIGRRAAVVQLPGGVKLRGTVAWLAWVALHIAALLGNRNRVSTLINLSWRYLARPGGGGMIVGDQPRPPGPRPGNPERPNGVVPPNPSHDART